MKVTVVSFEKCFSEQIFDQATGSNLKKLRHPIVFPQNLDTSMIARKDLN